MQDDVVARRQRTNKRSGNSPRRARWRTPRCWGGDACYPRGHSELLNEGLCWVALGQSLITRRFQFLLLVRGIPPPNNVNSCPSSSPDCERRKSMCSRIFPALRQSSANISHL